MTTILKSLVGSRAHGLNRPDSDYDWRGVFVQPTKEILSLGYSQRSIQWLEGKEDFTNYEIGHYLMLASKANPSVLELLVSPQINFGGLAWGKELVELLPYLYDPADAFNAFTGYSLNQRKKLLDDKDGRMWKYSVAYIRTLYALVDLLSTGTFALAVTDIGRLAILKVIRDGDSSVGDVINHAKTLEHQAKLLLPDVKSKKDPERINDYLLRVRKEFW